MKKKTLAEKKIRADEVPGTGGLSGEAAGRLIHELQTHQAELETQNEELCRQQNEIEASRNKYIELYDFAPVGYFTLGEKAVILETNLTGAALLGAEKKMLIGTPLTRFIFRDDQDIFYFHFNNISETKDPRAAEIRMKKTDGTFIYTHLQSKPVSDDGDSIRILTAITDITRCRHAEDHLRTSEAQKNAILDGITARLIFVNKDLEIQWANKVAATAVNCSPEEMAGHRCYEFLGHSEPCEGCPAAKVFKTKVPEQKLIHAPDGTVANKRGEPVFDTNGHLIGVVAISHDITEEVLTEELLRESYEHLKTEIEKQTADLLKSNERLSREIEENRLREEALRRYEVIISTIRDPMSIIDRNYIYQTVNDAHAEFFQKKRAEIAGHSTTEIFGTDVFEKKIKRHIDQCLAGKEVHYQDWFDPPAGDPKFMDISYYPLLIENGSVPGIIANARDITNIKQTEETLVRRSHDLAERIKELNCIYSIFKLLEKQYLSWDEVFMGIVNLIPPAWQYSAITCARLVIQDREFRTANFRETAWKQQSNISVYGEKIGILEVCYLEKKPNADEGPFMKEERDLISAIADHVGKDIEHKQLHESLEQANKRLVNEHRQRKDLSKKLIKLLEKDRQNIAMELHDQVGQTLTSIKINLEVTENQLKSNDINLNTGGIQSAKEKVTQAIRDIKNISHGLRPAMLDTLGLVSALRELFNEVERESDIDIQFFSRKIPKHFCKEKEIAIYRIAQESLNNAIKHARTKQVFVSLVKKDQRALLSVEDDGVGFEPGKIMKNHLGKHLGLVFMRERVIQLDGEFNIESCKGGGTLVLADIPL